MAFFQKIGGVVSTLFGSFNAKNEALSTLTQQNAMLSSQALAQAQQNKGFDMGSIMPIALIAAVVVIPLMLFKKK